MSKIDLSKPSVRGLKYALRHKNVWPEGFVWDYGCPDYCAIGLAKELWPEHIISCNSLELINALFNTQLKSHHEIVEKEHKIKIIQDACLHAWESTSIKRYSRPSPTPEDVASILDQLGDDV